MAECNYEKIIMKFKKIMGLWVKEGYAWSSFLGNLYLDNRIPEDREHDVCVCIDMSDYSYACFNRDTYQSMVISEKEHKLITKTINVLKEMNKCNKEVE